MSSVLRCLLLVVCLLAASAAPAGTRVALVLGNGAYKDTAPLANPVNDARAVASAFEGLGFKTRLAVDATREAMLAAVDGFLADLDGAEAAVLYYSGHGMQIGEENYLLPVDISVESDLSVRYGAVGIDDLLSEMEGRAGVAIVILDACRDNPFVEALRRKPGGTRSTAASRGLARIAPSGNGAIVAFAARAGAVASDGTGDHSPYTAALLAELPKPGVEVGLLFRRVAGHVIRDTGGAQTPELLMRLTEEFYLRPAEGPVAQPVAAAAPPTTVVVAVSPPPTPPTPPPSDKGVAPDGGGGTGDKTADRARERFAALWSYSPPPTPLAPRAPRPEAAVPAARSIREAEPNNDWRSATTIGPADTISAAIFPRGDVDRYTIEAPDAGSLTLEVAATQPTLDATLRLIDWDGRVVLDWVRAPRPGDGWKATADLVRPGRYWLEVRDWNDDGEAPEPFDVALGFRPSPDRLEPNDTIADAAVLALPAEVPLAILPRGDHDWFRVATDRQGLLRVAIGGVPADLELAFRVLDEDGVVMLDWVRPPRPGGEATADASLPRPGVFAIEVAEWGDDARSVDAARLSVAFLPDSDATEPNAPARRAFPVAIDGRVPLTLFPRGDRDTLALDVVEPGRLSVELTGADPNFDLAFRVADADGVVVADWTRAPRPGGDASGYADIARPGRYLVEILDWNDDAFSLKPFETAFAFSKSPDRFEPNDTIAFAQPLTPGGEVAIALLPRGDRDNFRVTVESAGELAVAIDEGPADQDRRFRVLDARGNVLTDWVAPYAIGGRTEGFADLRAAGTYLLQVLEWGDDQASPEPAVLSTRLTPAPDAFEPNDLWVDARPIAAEGTVSAFILPRGDIDRFLVDVAGAGTLALDLADAAPTLDLAFRVTDVDGRVLLDWTRAQPGGGVEGSAKVEAAGQLAVEVRDWGDDGRATTPYRLTTRWTPGS